MRTPVRFWFRKRFLRTLFGSDADTSLLLSFKLLARHPGHDGHQQAHFGHLEAAEAADEQLLQAAPGHSREVQRVISLRGGSTADVQVKGGERGLGTQGKENMMNSNNKRKKNNQEEKGKQRSGPADVLFVVSVVRSQAVLSIWWRSWRKWASGPWRRRTARPR